MESLSRLLDASAAMHHHLCPRQVLGVRIGLLAGRKLGLALSRAEKRLLALVETDGCFADGVSVATNCWVGRRTLRVEDYGKVAAAFVDTQTGRSVRIAPRPEARRRAAAYAPEACDTWEAQLLGYQRMPDDELCGVQPVRLKAALEKLISHSGHRTVCQICGEEIINEREVVHDGGTICRSCWGDAYYILLTTNADVAAHGAAG